MSKLSYMQLAGASIINIMAMAECCHIFCRKAEKHTRDQHFLSDVIYLRGTRSATNINTEFEEQAPLSETKLHY